MQRDGIVCSILAALLFRIGIGVVAVGSSTLTIDNVEIVLSLPIQQFVFLQDGTKRLKTLKQQL
jgi:hypothetical protein